MSHAATNWAIKQRGLKPATKIVLWHLADCHNGHTGQCNPKQSTLASLCEMSRSTLNLHLSKLERSGLIRRVTSVDSETKKQRPTHYVLAMDDAQKPVSENEIRTQDVDTDTTTCCASVSENETRLVSENRTKPCPDSEHSRVLKSDTKNLGREPGKQASSSAREAMSDDQLFDEVLSAAGIRNGQMPSYWMPPAAVIHVGRWRTQLGLTDAEILATVRESRKRHDTPPSGPKGLDRAMQRTAGAKSTDLKPIHSQHGTASEKSKRMAFYESITAKAGGAR